jgi:hypothetical protein
MSTDLPGNLGRDEADEAIANTESEFGIRCDHRGCAKGPGRLFRAGVLPHWKDPRVGAGAAAGRR